MKILKSCTCCCIINANKQITVWVFFIFHSICKKQAMTFIYSELNVKWAVVSVVDNLVFFMFVCVCYTVLEMTFSVKFEVGFLCLYNIISLFVLFISSRKKLFTLKFEPPFFYIFFIFLFFWWFLEIFLIHIYIILEIKEFYVVKYSIHH